MTTPTTPNRHPINPASTTPVRMRLNHLTPGLWGLTADLAERFAGGPFLGVDPLLAAVPAVDPFLAAALDRAVAPPFAVPAPFAVPPALEAPPALAADPFLAGVPEPDFGRLARPLDGSEREPEPLDPDPVMRVEPLSAAGSPDRPLGMRAGQP
jgi:hypothetical protein